MTAPQALLFPTPPESGASSGTLISGVFASANLCKPLIMFFSVVENNLAPMIAKSKQRLVLLLRQTTQQKRSKERRQSIIDRSDARFGFASAPNYTRFALCSVSNSLSCLRTQNSLK